jgi:hypothetical protein
MPKQMKNNHSPKTTTADEVAPFSETKLTRRFFKGRRLQIVSYVVFYGLGIITTLAALAAVYPWVTISELRTTKPHDPFNLRLLLKNEGFWKIRDIRVKCSVFSIESGGRNQIIETTFEDQKEVRHGLKPKHHTNSQCAPNVQDAENVKRAALAISVSFERFYFPWKWRREEPSFVYTLERGKANQITWLPEG